MLLLTTRPRQRLSSSHPPASKSRKDCCPPGKDNKSTCQPVQCLSPNLRLKSSMFTTLPLGEYLSMKMESCPPLESIDREAWELWICPRLACMSAVISLPGGLSVAPSGSDQPQDPQQELQKAIQPPARAVNWGSDFFPCVYTNTHIHLSHVLLGKKMDFT